jgi:hypothetical protein
MEKESEQESERNLQIMGEKELAAEEARAFRRGGFHATLEWNLSLYQQRAAKRYVSPIIFAWAYAQLRRKEETLRYLEQAYVERAPNMVWVQGFPDFDFVHPDPRYRAIIKKMGLPPAY